MFNDTKKTALKYAIAFSLLAGLSLNGTAEAASPRRDIKEGNRQYQKGDYAQAIDEYQEALKKAPESDIVHFNLGAAAYKEKEYEQAADHFQKVFLTENEQLKENAYYNFGNVLYQKGLMQEEENVEKAVESLKSALGQYERALSMDKEDKDAKHNYDYVKKELIRLQQKQQQQQQQNQQSQENQQGQEQQQQQQQDQQGKEEKQDQQQQQSSQEKQEGQKSQSQQEQEKQGAQQQQQDEPKSSGQKGEEQEEKEKSGQGRGQGEEEDYNKQQQAGAQPQDAEGLTPKEAQMLLESYERTEEPRGLLNVHPRANDSSPVFKDW